MDKNIFSVTEKRQICEFQHLRYKKKIVYHAISNIEKMIFFTTKIIYLPNYAISYILIQQEIPSCHEQNQLYAFGI